MSFLLSEVRNRKQESAKFLASYFRPLTSNIMANEIQQAVQLIAEEKGLSVESIIATIDKAFMPVLVIPIDHINEENLIKAFIDKNIEEKKIEEPFAHRIMDKLGF